jgi:dCMP deaminase
MLNHKNFINIAKELAKASKCVSKKVGAVIVKDNRILSTGYNGTPQGYVNCNEHWNNEYTKEHHNWSQKYEIHAEMNAIIWASKNGIKIDNSTIYTTLQPCEQCTKNIIASGIKKIIYEKEYDKNNTKEILNFLKANNVAIQKLNI